MKSCTILDTRVWVRCRITACKGASIIYAKSTRISLHRRQVYWALYMYDLPFSSAKHDAQLTRANQLLEQSLNGTSWRRYPQSYVCYEQNSVTCSVLYCARLAYLFLATKCCGTALPNPTAEAIRLRQQSANQALPDEIKLLIIEYWSTTGAGCGGPALRQVLVNERMRENWTTDLICHKTYVPDVTVAESLGEDDDARCWCICRRLACCICCCCCCWWWCCECCWSDKDEVASIARPRLYVR